MEWTTKRINVAFIIANTLALLLLALIGPSGGRILLWTGATLINVVSLVVHSRSLYTITRAQHHTAGE